MKVVKQVKSYRDINNAFAYEVDEKKAGFEEILGSILMWCLVLVLAVLFVYVQVVKNDL